LKNHVRPKGNSRRESKDKRARTAPKAEILGESERGIDVPLPPPLIFFGLFVIGSVAGYFIPIHLLPGGAALPTGIVIALAGVYLSFVSLREFARAETPPDFRPVKAIVSAGPYRYTRNPIYISFSTIYAGLGIAFNSLVAFLPLLVAIAVVDRVIVPREERYLEHRFGEEYLRYKAKVRRWV